MSFGATHFYDDAVGRAPDILPTIPVATPTTQLDVELTRHLQDAVSRHTRRQSRSQQSEFHSLRFDSLQEHSRRASAQYSSRPRLSRRDIQDAVDTVRFLRWRNLSLANSRRHNVRSALLRQSHPNLHLLFAYAAHIVLKFLLLQTAVKILSINVLFLNLSSM